MAKKKKPSPFDEVMELTKNVIALWMEFRKFLRKSFSMKPVSSQEEQRFLEVKSELSRMQRLLAAKLPSGLQYGAKDVSELMTSCISIGSLRDLPSNDKKKMYARWHGCHIAIQRLLGTLDVLCQGFPIHFKTAKRASGNLKESLGMVKSKKRNGIKIAVIVLGLLIAVAFAARMMLG